MSENKTFSKKINVFISYFGFDQVIWFNVVKIKKQDCDMAMQFKMGI